MEQVKSNQDLLYEMADSYEKLGNEMAQIENEEASALLILMASSKTNREADMKWRCTESGKRQTELKYLLRGLEKKMTALKTKIHSDRAY